MSESLSILGWVVLFFAVIGALAGVVIWTIENRK